MMLANTKDIQANFLRHNRHADQALDVCECTDTLMRLGVRNEFAEAINADFHYGGSPSPFLYLERHNSLFHIISRGGTALAITGPGLILGGALDLDQWVGLGPGSLKYFCEQLSRLRS